MWLIPTHDIVLAKFLVVDCLPKSIVLSIIVVDVNVHALLLQPEKVKPPQLLVEEEDDLFSSAAASATVSRYVVCCHSAADVVLANRLAGKSIYKRIYSVSSGI